jgi:hypothetical protein
MTVVRYSLNRGETQFQVTEDVGTTVTASMEFTFDLTTCSRLDLLLALDAITRHVLQAPFPPA